MQARMKKNLHVWAIVLDLSLYMQYSAGMETVERMNDQMAVMREVAGDCLAVRVRLVNRVITSIYDTALRPHGLRISQMNLLVAIGFRGRISPGELSQRLCVDESTVSRNVDRMVSQGWLKTTGKFDRRAHDLELTEEGQALVGRALPAWRKAQRQARELIGDHLQRELVRTGNRLIREGI